MNSFAEKMRLVERDLSTEEGPFLLFALFLRDEPAEYWDLLVSAPWVEANKGRALRRIASKLQSVATPEELAKLSRIVIVEKAASTLAAVNMLASVEHGMVEVRDSSFNGLKIKHAYVITSRKEKSPV